MNKEIQAKWLEELRSGKHQQGRTTLRNNDDEFCCLGVLCNVIDPSKWVAGPVLWSYDGGHGREPTESLPTSVLLETVGLQYGTACRLAELNDRGVSFASIADAIESGVIDGEEV